MLARLDEELDPHRAQTDYSGAFVRITGSPNDATIERAASVLRTQGLEAEPFSEETMVERWYGATEVTELSIKEAQILSARWSEEVAPLLGLSSSDQSSLTSSLHDAILGIIEGRRSGEGDPSLDEFMEVAHSACSQLLTDSQWHTLEAWLREKMGKLLG